MLLCGSVLARILSHLMDRVASCPRPRATRPRVEASTSTESQPRRISLRQSLTGDQVCLPGVSTEKNGWTVPGYYLIRNLLRVLVLKVAENGTVDSEGERFRIAGVLMASNSRPAPAGLTVGECGSVDDVVQVLYGEDVLDADASEFEARPCADLDSVRTPVTPSSCGDVSE